MKLAAVLLAAGMATSAAHAQQHAKQDGGPVLNGMCGIGDDDGGQPIETPDPPPPVPSKLATSPGGVDMQSGTFTYRNTDISIGGEGDAGLSLSRVFSYAGTQNLNEQMFGQFFSHDWNIQLRETRSAVPGACYPEDYDYNVVVAYGDLGEGFRSAAIPNSFRQTAPRGYAKLTRSGSAYTFEARDGTVVVFSTTFSGCSGYWTIVRCTYATQVTRPDGTVYTLGYDSSGQRVVSNRGYALILENGSSGISKVCALNLAVTVMPSTNACPSGVLTATYTYSGSDLTSATEASGGTWTYSHNSTAKTWSVTRPGDSSPYVTNTYALYKGVSDQDYSLSISSQSFAAGSGYTYTWDQLVNFDQQGYPTPQVVGGRWTDANGDYASLTFGQYKVFSSSGADPTLRATPGPISIRDQLGNVTTADYCGSTAQGAMCDIPPLKSVTSPEGNKEEYTYDSYNNITQVTKKAKSGSGLSDIVEAKTFSSTYPVYRAKPLTVTDALSNVTTYTYDSTHGGVLTEVGPAVGGVSPAKKYAYTLRKAWISNGSGFVQPSTGVYLLTEERSCRTSALNLTTGACGGGTSDLVVVAYDYGPDTGAVGNNLLLRGKAVTADGTTLRTCYGYDSQGNKIWETSPRAGLTVCS